MSPSNPVAVASQGLPSWLKLEQIAEAAVFTILGAVLFVGLFWLIDKLTPADLWKELIEEHNTALAVVIGSFAIALGLIVSAAVQG